MRHIYINGRFVTHLLTGTERYANELLCALDALLVQRSSSLSVTLLVPSSSRSVPSFTRINVRRVGRCAGRLWEQFELPFYARRGLLYTLAGGAPVIHRRNVVTVHDASVCAVPSGYSFWFRTWYQVLYRLLCNTALHILTVSEYSRGEIVRWFGARSERVTVTYLGSEHSIRPEPDLSVLSRSNLNPRQFILSVASLNPNKNLAGIMSASSIAPLNEINFALVGGRQPGVFATYQGPLRGTNVVSLGYISDSELRALYMNAACFVFPSFYEGFGLPPLEALANGCPVVVSDRTSLSEVFGEIAHMCDPGEPGSIAAAILDAINNRGADSEALFAFARRFSWHECARTTLEVLERYANAP